MSDAQVLNVNGEKYKPLGDFVLVPLREDDIHVINTRIIYVNS